MMTRREILENIPEFSNSTDSGDYESAVVDYVGQVVSDFEDEVNNILRMFEVKSISDLHQLQDAEDTLGQLSKNLY